MNSGSAGYKNHFNFRLHVQIDTIKQTDKNNDHIHRNKTSKPVNPSLHNLTGNTEFKTHKMPELRHETFFGNELNLKSTD